MRAVSLTPPPWHELNTEPFYPALRFTFQDSALTLSEFVLNVFDPLFERRSGIFCQVCVFFSTDCLCRVICIVSQQEKSQHWDISCPLRSHHKNRTFSTIETPFCEHHQQVFMFTHVCVCVSTSMWGLFVCYSTSCCSQDSVSWEVSLRKIKGFSTKDKP